MVAEPTCNYPFVGHKGAFWLLGRTSGVTAHGSMPARGVNAVYEAARAAVRLEQFRFEVTPHPVLGAPTLNVGTLHGGLNVNSIPDLAEIGIDIRTIPEQKHGPGRVDGSRPSVDPVLVRHRRARHRRAPGGSRRAVIHRRRRGAQVATPGKNSVTPV